VLEAYIGALAEDETSHEALTGWFEAVFGPDSRVFPSMAREAMEKESKMAEAVKRKTTAGCEFAFLEPVLRRGSIVAERN